MSRSTSARESRAFGPNRPPTASPQSSRWLPYRLEVWRDGEAVAMAFPDWELPSRQDGGGTLGVGEVAREELARWYGNAHTLLTAVAQRTEWASEVRRWPLAHRRLDGGGAPRREHRRGR